jgi:hypothetical protein
MQELTEVKEGTVRLTAAEYMDLMKEIRTLEKTKDEALSAGSKLMELSIKKSIEVETQRAIMLQHLSNMLDEQEKIFEREGFASTEFAYKYIEAAKAARHLGRKEDLIRFVEELIYSEYSLPFPKA